MATHSSVLAWRIPGTGQPGGLPSMGSHRVGHDCSDLAAAAAAAAATNGKEPASQCQCRRLKTCGFNPWVRKIAWRRKWLLTPVFLPGKSHGQRSLVGYSSWGCKESGITEETQRAYMKSEKFSLILITTLTFTPNKISTQTFPSPWS